MTRPLIDPFQRVNGDWFTRNEPKIEPTTPVRTLVNAAIGVTTNRWVGNPNLDAMATAIAAHPDVLDTIGARLLATMVGIKGCGPAIALLLERGVPFEMDMGVYNQMHEGAWCGAVDTLLVLFEAGVADATPVSVEKPHLGWPSNISLMYWAAFRGDVELTKVLLRYGVGKHHELEMGSNGEHGATVLQETCAPPKVGSREDHLEVAHLLIDDGAYYDIGSACAMNDLTRVRTLLDDDPQVANTPLQFNMTPLHWAARTDAVDAVKLLLDKGVDVNALTNAHRTALQLAAETDASASIALLAKAGADLNTQDKKGRTPLHRATYEGKVAAAEALLEHGADPTVTNKSGKTAFQIARKEAKFFKTEAT
ncbi:MAG: ankyrin repeat domain-containing protein [Gammaproteobacteria bacterium]|nr:ankyrin repeat domain-containing protein [Gammaproteobacteria bacterium]